MPESVNHPSHYGGDTTYETIKVIEAWELDFHLGNAVKYISRAGKKGSTIEDLQKAAWYLQRKIALAQSSDPAATALALRDKDPIVPAEETSSPIRPVPSKPVHSTQIDPSKALADSQSQPPRKARKRTRAR